MDLLTKGYWQRRSAKIEQNLAWPVARVAFKGSSSKRKELFCWLKKSKFLRVALFANVRRVLLLANFRLKIRPFRDWYHVIFLLYSKIKRHLRENFTSYFLYTKSYLQKTKNNKSLFHSHLATRCWTFPDHRSYYPKPPGVCQLSYISGNLTVPN